MTNKAIAKTFQYLADIMELHGENPYKIRSYANAYLQLRKLDMPLADMDPAEIGAIKGVGEAISAKIQELLQTGHLNTLKKYEDQTPEGVREMLQVPGFGPKKVRVIWKDLGVETIGELLYACNENRLVELKGFGEKTQEDLRQKLLYYQQAQGRFHYATLDKAAQPLLNWLQGQLPGVRIELCGDIRRKLPILTHIEILLGTTGALDALFAEGGLQDQQTLENGLLAQTTEGLPVKLYPCEPETFGSKWFRYTGEGQFLKAFAERSPGTDFKGLAGENEVFQKAGLPYLAPELREDTFWLDQAAAGKLPTLLEEHDIKGVVHVHSTYSDGLHSLEQMARAAKDMGYQYLLITDHSQSAFYANGLKVDRLEQQWTEIEALNRELAPFVIFKGIESDILNDGSLDYPDDILAQFDAVIASVHSNLRMDQEKATARLIKAIENPYTSILGHPTGRLLLSREGYPIDHLKIIDACAKNGVAIELNANPHRLDLDYTWIQAALERGVKICINPDAHSMEGIRDIRYGVAAARKGGLDAANCLNTRDANGFKNSLRRP